MAISPDEQTHLFAELADALNCPRYPQSAEQLRLALWAWLDDRRAMIKPPSDRRSAEIRDHVPTLGPEDKENFLARERYRALVREGKAG